MLKVSRTKSSDPFQEKIREGKAELNKEVSSLIDDIINFKKLMNGWPNKFIAERGFIKNPILGFPSAIIEGMANDFAQIANKSKLIIEQQAEYSQMRRKKQVANIEKPASLVYNLESNASNRLSRFFTRLVNIDAGSSERASVKKFRMSLLTSLVKIDKKLSIFEKEIVRTSVKENLVLIELLNEIGSSWSFIKEQLALYKSKNVQENPIEEPIVDDKVIPADKPTLESEIYKKEFDAATSAIRDFKNNISKFTEFATEHTDVINNFEDLCKEFLWVKDDNKLTYVRDLIAQYNDLLSLLNFIYKTDSSSIKDIFLELSSINKAKIKEDKIKEDKLKKDKLKEDKLKEVSAQNNLLKWIHKIKHELNPMDETSDIRLKTYKLLSETRECINKMMDSVEDDLNIESLESLEKDVSSYLFDIAKNINILNSSESIHLDQSQKERVQRNVKLKRIRELSNSYNKKS